MAPRKTPVEGGSKWQWFVEPQPSGEYLALATYIQLRSVWTLPRFEWYTQQVHRQLSQAPGLVGYSFRGEFPKKYWTLSAWETPRHLLDFIRTMPHARVRSVLPGSFERFDSVRWQADGSALPLTWAEALSRLDEKQSAGGLDAQIS
jgi:hypothetical protein